MSSLSTDRVINLGIYKKLLFMCGWTTLDALEEQTYHKKNVGEKRYLAAARRKWSRPVQGRFRVLLDIPAVAPKCGAVIFQFIFYSGPIRLRVAGHDGLSVVDQ